MSYLYSKLPETGVSPHIGTGGRQRGAVRRTRGARAPHSGQADGSSHSAIARICVNGPHFLHIYSYVGIDHLPPA